MSNRLQFGLVAAVVFVLVLGMSGALITFAPNTHPYEGERSVKIPPGADFEAVVDSLEARDMLRSPRTFRWIGTLTGWRDQIKAGHYTFASGVSNHELLDRIRKGLETPIRVLIPPGTRPEIVAETAARGMAFDADDFRSALRDSSLAAEVGTDTTHLFGYMLPDTYHAYWLTPAEDVVRRVKREFDAYYDRALARGADTLSISQEEVITLASIIQWETGRLDEKSRIAGVYLNRMERGMPLQADPTVQYAVLQEEGERRRLLFDDYEIDHPYNTYHFRGLPPGPLTNPSRHALEATVTPEEHEYLYFVATGDGGHTFSRTFQEHVRAANEYRELMRERRREQE